MINKIIKKSIVIGIIILFFGASFIPITSANEYNSDNIVKNSKINFPAGETGRDDPMTNINCVLSATFYDECDVLYTGIGFHALVVIDCQGHWEASTLGLLGYDDIECYNGGTLICIGLIGPINLERGHDENGGSLSGLCFFVDGNCW